MTDKLIDRPGHPGRDSGVLGYEVPVQIPMEHLEAGDRLEELLYGHHSSC